MEAASSFILSCDAKHVHLYFIIIAFYDRYLADCVGLETYEMRTAPLPPKNDRLAFEKMAEAGRSHSDLFLPFFPESGYVISAWSVLGGKDILISEDTGTQIIICTGLANFLQVYYQRIMPIVPHPHLSIPEYFIRRHKNTELNLIDS